MTLPSLRRTVPARLARCLRDNRSGVALIEFALALPCVLAVGLYAIENANLALANLRVSQAALNLADNASRVGLMNALSVEQLRELDMNDVLNATKLQGTSWNLTTRGRITVSSMENVQQTYDAAPVQRIHWQRCIGSRSGAGYDSSYGTTTIAAGTDNTQGNAGTAVPNGMGDPGAQVQAPPGSSVIFVEVNYDYQPAVSSLWLSGSAIKLHYIASFVVRDRRDLQQIYNPSPTVARSTCDLHNS